MHAFSALEVWQGAATLGVPLDDYLARLRDAGLASLPGTAAEILDDEVRARPLPRQGERPAQWLEVHDTAHRARPALDGTIMFGHVDTPQQLGAPPAARPRAAAARPAGSPSSCRCPFVHMEAPIYLKGRARRGPTFREVLLMHAVARLALHPWITNVQASWVKLGLGRRRGRAARRRATTSAGR